MVHNLKASYTVMIDDLFRRLCIIAALNPEPEIMSDLDSLVLDYAGKLNTDELPDQFTLRKKYASEIEETSDKYEASRRMRKSIIELNVDKSYVRVPSEWLLTKHIPKSNAAGLKKILKDTDIICGVAVSGVVYGAAAVLKARELGYDIPYATLIPEDKDSDGHPSGFFSTIDFTGSRVLVIDDVISKNSATKIGIEMYLSARSSSGLYVAGILDQGGADYSLSDLFK